MKICFIAPANNYHTIKWCKWFCDCGHEVEVISYINASIDNVKVHYINTGVNVNGKDINKIKYLFKANKIRKMVEEIKPDIINVHYATSYGMSVALSRVKNYILSVWGTDVYDFPNKSIIHKMMLKYSLKRAKYIFSTSKAMAKETKKYTKKDIIITPFGVDMELFSPEKKNNENKDFIVGTVKSLEYVYGIDDILKAVNLVKKIKPEIPIKVRIAGTGTKEKEYKELSERLGIREIVTWLGFISQEDAAKEWANMNLGIIPSLQESFGVAAIEAQACGTPVIISDCDGLKETTIPGDTSVIVESKNPYQIADKIIELYYDYEKRLIMGKKGREYVKSMYEYNACFSRIEEIYKKINNEIRSKK